MWNARWDYLFCAGADSDTDWWIRRHTKANAAIEHSKPSPGACWDSMGILQPRRQGVFVPRTSGCQMGQSVRQFGSIARWAIDLRTEVGSTSSLIENPRMVLERRMVANMLVV